jgi:hypothetical protein
MQIPLVDKSTYLKGLLILARKDNRLSEEDKGLITTAAIHLGFSSDFYEEVLGTFMNNKHINNDPVQFRNNLLAHHFLSDAITLACINNGITKDELYWLKETAELNFVNPDWFENEIKKCRGLIKSYDNYNLAVYSIS